MKLSEATDKLFKAFSKFQGELENASKGKEGHGYKYADLAECINTAKPVLMSNGLAVSQMLGMTPDGKQTLITMLTHESGQYMSSEFVMVDAKLMGGAGNNPAQVLGSAITYQRRYAYAAIIGLAQEDDDAHSVQRAPNQQQKPQQRQQQKPAQLKSQHFDGQDFLKRWTHIAQSCQATQTLDQQKDKVLNPAWAQLNQQQRAAAKEVYDACKEDLETKGA